MTAVATDNLVTVPQLRRMHALGRNLGLDHEGLRDAGGVASLKQLTRAQAHRLIERLQVGTAAKAGIVRLCNTPYGDASRQQRAAIWAKLKQLQQDCGWSAQKCTGWLQRRYGIKTPYADGLQIGQARAILSALDHTLRKERERVAQARSDEATKARRESA